MGSSPIFVKTKISECSAVGSVSVLGIEGHVFKSHYSDTFLINYAVFTFIFNFFSRP